MYTNPKSKHERKLLNEAQQMLSDSKTKVEVLKMKIMRLNVMSSTHKDEEGESERNQKISKSAPTQTPEGRVSMLRYRIDVESRLMQGARSIIKANPKAKSSQSVGWIVSRNRDHVLYCIYSVHCLIMLLYNIDISLPNFTNTHCTCTHTIHRLSAA